MSNDGAWNSDEDFFNLLNKDTFEYHCPHCGAGHNWTGDPLGQDESGDDECRVCEKMFKVIAHVTHYYTTEKP